MIEIHTGINDPNRPNTEAEPKPKMHNGKKALAWAVSGIVLVSANFGIPKAFAANKESIDKKGFFKDGKYYVKTPPSKITFMCHLNKKVFRHEVSIDELGEGSESKENYGGQNGACTDERLTPEDGNFTKPKIDPLGIIGKII